MSAPSALHTAFVDALTSNADLTVVDGQAPDSQPPPWVQVVSDAGFRTQTAWGWESDTLEVTVVTTCVGATPLAARIVADLVVEQMVDRVLSVDGWTAAPLRQSASRGVTKDVDVPDLWHMTPTWQLIAHRTDTP